MAPAKKLRLSTVITGMTFGGAQRILIDYLSRLPDWIDKEVIGVYPGAMAEFLRERNIPVIEYDFRGKSTWKAIPKLRDHFLKTRPHIVHTHLGKADFVGRAAARMAGVPVVISTCHNKDHWKEKPVLNFLDNQSMKMADEIIAVSKAAKDYLVLKGHPADHIRVSYARVELRERFPSTEISEERRAEYRRELNIPDDAVVSIMVGRMYPQKAQEIAIQALAQIEGLDRPHVFLMAGDGPQREEQEALAKRLLKPELYRFLGNRKDIEDLLRFSDVYVMPSRWEGAPLALQEAFAAGLPAVISDIPSMSEVSESCGGAVTFPMDDPKGMAAKWKLVLQDENLRTKLCANARKNALEKWDIRILCDEYLKCYADNCKRSKKLRQEDVPEELYEYLKVKPLV